MLYIDMFVFFPALDRSNYRYITRGADEVGLLFFYVCMYSTVYTTRKGFHASCIPKIKVFVDFFSGNTNLSVIGSSLSAKAAATVQKIGPPFLGGPSMSHEFEKSLEAFFICAAQ